VTPIIYGRAIVGAAFLSHLLSYGVLTVAFGIFFPFMAEALGLSRGVLASTGVATRLVAAALAPVVGPLVDRRGPRVPMLAGVVGLAAGAAVLAGARNAWHVFLGFGVLMSIGFVTLGELTGDVTVARWFVRRRGRALAWATMGLSAGGVVLPLPLAWLIGRFGWRAAWLALGREAARTSAFWLLVLSTNLAALALLGANLHLFSYITDKRVPAGVAAGLVTYLYVLQAMSKPLWGHVAERLPVRYCIAACYVGGAAGLVLLMWSASLPALLGFATVYGLTRGAQVLVTSLAWADYFGRGAQGTVRGLAAPFRLAASTVGPVLGGVLYDVTGGYALPFGLFAAAFALAGGVALAARPPARGPG
jgi:MFS family permease